VEFLRCPRCDHQIDMTIENLDWAVSGPRDIAQRLIAQYHGREYEQCDAIYMNVRGKVLRQVTIAIGSVAEAHIPISSILREGLRLNAARFAVVHGHPSNEVEPSSSDIALSASILAAARAVEMEFIDHLVIGSGGSWVSMRDLGFQFDPRPRP